MKKKTIITPNDDQLKNIATKHRRCSFVYYFFFAWVWKLKKKKIGSFEFREKWRTCKQKIKIDMNAGFCIKLSI